MKPSLRNGFTLIELLVVIGIIVLLIAILLPALGHARTVAYNSQSEAVVTHLQAAIETYYQSFQAYPGPATINDTAGSSKKLSGSQNLLLGLAYSMTNANSALIPLPFGSPAMRVDPTKPNGPTNLGNIRPDNTPEQMAPFFEVNSKLLSKNTPGNSTAGWPPTGVVTNAAGTNKFAFPVLVDAFPDPLPILYYRRTPGVDKPATVDASAGPSSGSYYWADNKEYTACSSDPGNQNPDPQDGGRRAAMFNSDTGVNELNSIVQTSSGIRGGYLLIGAGIDRRYGKVKGASDDIIRIGGN